MYDAFQGSGFPDSCKFHLLFLGQVTLGTLREWRILKKVETKIKLYTCKEQINAGNPQAKLPSCTRNISWGFQGSTVICRKFFMVHPNETHRSTFGHKCPPPLVAVETSQAKNAWFYGYFCFGAFFFATGAIYDICVKHSLKCQFITNKTLSNGPITMIHYCSIRRVSELLRSQMLHGRPAEVNIRGTQAPSFVSKERGLQ